MVQRIQTIMEHYQLKPAQFADAIGMQRSAVSHVLSGRNKPSLDFIMRIKRRFPEIRLDWLVLGSGDMFGNENATTAVSQDLFSAKEGTSQQVVDAEKQVKVKKPVQEPTARPSEQVEDEEMAPYYSSGGLLNGKVEQVMVFYADGSFKVYRPRRG